MANAPGKCARSLSERSLDDIHEPIHALDLASLCALSLQGLNYFGELPNAVPIVSLAVSEEFLCITLLPTLDAIEPVTQKFYQVGEGMGGKGTQ